jgi:hypothetical protein
MAWYDLSDKLKENRIEYLVRTKHKQILTAKADNFHKMSIKPI